MRNTLRNKLRNILRKTMRNIWGITLRPCRPISILNPRNILRNRLRNSYTLRNTFRKILISILNARNILRNTLKNSLRRVRLVSKLTETHVW